MPAKTPYRIELQGCDDTTYIDMDLTLAEATFLKRVADASVAESGYGCQPVMTVEIRSPGE